MKIFKIGIVILVFIALIGLTANYSQKDSTNSSTSATTSSTVSSSSTKTSSNTSSTTSISVNLDNVVMKIFWQLSSTSNNVRLVCVFGGVPLNYIDSIYIYYFTSSTVDFTTYTNGDYVADLNLKEDIITQTYTSLEMTPGNVLTAQQLFTGGEYIVTSIAESSKGKYFRVHFFLKYKDDMVSMSTRDFKAME